MTAPQCFADEIQESHQADLEQAEWLLQDIVRQNRMPTAGEYAFFLRCGWDEVRARDQVRRVSQALNQQTIAGDPSTREAAATEAATAAKLLESEAPKIREKLDKLQKQLDGLERDARLSAKRVEQQVAAVAKCREFPPPAVRAKVDAALKILNTSGVGKTLRDAQERHHELRLIVNDGVYDSPATHIDFALRRLCPAAVRTVTQGRMLSYSYSEAWPGLKAAAEAEFSELNSKLPELQAAFDAEVAAIETALDFYSTGQAND